MKRIASVIIAVVLSLLCLSVVSFAESAYISDNDTSITVMRAGGGGSGGSGGSGGGGGGGSHYHSHSSSGPTSLIGSIVRSIMIPIVLCSSAIVFYYKLFKRSRKAKKLMKQITESDGAWKFENIEKTVEEGFYAIQEAWSNLDMSPASQYMSDELFESFQTKLQWMELRHQKNVLKNIRLISALPVAVHDDPDNAHDHIWFYIKGKMVDYIVDTETQAKISGSIVPSSFVEYWQFVRKENGWVLNKILQKNESDQIVFSE